VEGVKGVGMIGERLHLSKMGIMIAVLMVCSMFAGGCAPVLFSTDSGKPAAPDDYFGFSSKKKPTINIDELELRIHELVNQERAKHGLSPLAWNPMLNKIARLHSQDMVTRNYFSHYSPEGHDLAYRYSRQGFVCEVAVGNMYYTGAENIFQNHLYDSIEYVNEVPTIYHWRDLERIARTTVTKWMNSPGHRVNILEPSWKTEGIGVAISNNYEVYITEEFC
jgi:uncharacterized protein YkwD